MRRSKAQIEIYVDGGPQFGFGHFSRMNALALYLRKKCFTVKIPLISEATTALVASEINGVKKTPDIVIVDLPYINEGLINSTRQLGIPIIVFDPLGKAQADVAIRTDPSEVNLPAKQIYTGLEYAIIREDVLNAKPQHGEYALVVIGGSDLGDLGVEAAVSLVKKNVRTILVRGPFSSYLKEPPAGVDLRIEPAELPELMAGCKFAVVNAGTTALELMFLGKPVHILPQTKAEHDTAERFLTDGLVLGVGLKSLILPGLEDADRVASIARAKVDGKGHQRVCSIIESLLVKNGVF